MRGWLTRARGNPRFARLFEWGRLVAIVGSGQALVQGLGLISGFMIIHLLSPVEYALYTLAYSMLGTIAPLADGGISHGVFARAARQWQDKDAMGRVLSTGLELRKKFAFVTLAISLPILFGLLLKHGAGWLTATLIVLALVPAFYAMLTDDLLSVPVRLNQAVGDLQKNEIQANIGRFALLGLGLLALPFAAIAILANGLPRVWANFKLRRIAQRYATFGAPTEPDARREILDLTKRTLPGTLYYCISGQISVWLISLFGSTQSIAEVGALGRLAMVLTILGTIFSTLIVPRFARQPQEPAPLLRRYLQIWLLVACMVAIVPFLVYLFPTQVLWILGRDYAGLTTEVVLSMLGSCLAVMAGSCYTLTVARGWVVRADINIISSLAVQVLLFFVFDLSTTAGVLKYAILNALWGVLLHSGYFLYRIRALRKEQAQRAANDAPPPPP